MSINAATLFDFTNTTNMVFVLDLLATYSLDNLDACLSNCSNKGVCYLTQSNSYACNCDKNYAGKSCKIDLRPCSSYPCLNGATCTETNNNTLYMCECDLTFFGNNCEKQINICANSSCIQDQGYCIVNKTFSNKMQCKCYSDYFGDNCELYSSSLRVRKIVITLASVIAIVTLGVFACTIISIDLFKLYIKKTTLKVARTKEDPIIKRLKYINPKDQIELDLMQKQEYQIELIDQTQVQSLTKPLVEETNVNSDIKSDSIGNNTEKIADSLDLKDFPSDESGMNAIFENTILPLTN